MNLLGKTGVFEKGQKRNRSNIPTKAQRERWERIRALGCSVCGGIAEIHHAFTGGGGRRDHDKVFPLCRLHHTGTQGIHWLGRKHWQELFGTEQEYLDKLVAIHTTIGTM